MMTTLLGGLNSNRKRPGRVIKNLPRWRLLSALVCRNDPFRLEIWLKYAFTLRTRSTCFLLSSWPLAGADAGFLASWADTPKPATIAVRKSANAVKWCDMG